MITSKVQLDLSSLLPDIPDERDVCVERLQRVLGNKSGIREVHTIANSAAKPAICLHYDPGIVTLAQVENLARSAGVEMTHLFGHAVLPLRAIDAEDAARRIEDSLRSVDGVLSASASLPGQVVRVEFERAKTSAEKVLEVLRDLGYASDVVATPAAPEKESRVEGERGWYGRNQELVWSLAAGLLLMAAWLGERWLGFAKPASVGIFVLSYCFGGYDLVRHTLANIRKGKFSFDIDLLMLLAAGGAAALGEWAEGAFLIFLFSLAHALEHYALGRARKAIKALAELAPPVARVLRDGGEAMVPVGEVAVGEIVVVRPGERIPTDGKIRAGKSAVNQAPITGESVPIDKAPEDEVFAGTINGEGALEVITSRAAGDRTLDRVIQMVQEAQTQKAPTQRFTDRFERVFVPLVLAADVVLIVLPSLAGWLTWGESFYRAMGLLVAASPCALALGTPSAVLAGIAQAARRGVLIKGGEHLENLGTLQAIALDKTGTITIGRPEASDLVPGPDVPEAELLSVAGAVEQRSQHPLAQAVVRRANASQIQLPPATDMLNISGRGVRSSVAGQVVEIGSLGLWEDSQTPVPDWVRNAVFTLQAKGRSTMAVRFGNRWLGVLGISDQPRPGVREILNEIRSLGVRQVVMLTGDNRLAAEAIRKESGVDEVRADLMPEAKVTAIRELLAAHKQVAMVGDGVNDAPALATATVGIAMGGAGTAAALETADVALMGDDLGKLPYAVALSRLARRIIRQNLMFSLSVIVLLVLVTVTGVGGIGFAVAAHEGTTLLVVVNALRLLTFEEDRTVTPKAVK